MFSKAMSQSSGGGRMVVVLGGVWFGGKGYVVLDMVVLGVFGLFEIVVGLWVRFIKCQKCSQKLCTSRLWWFWVVCAGWRGWVKE